MPSERAEGFPASHRLKRRADFQRVYSHGDRVSGRYLVLFVMRAEQADGRFGVTVTRRIGSAVVRSRCKRRLRELYRRHREADGLHRFDIVANARRGCATAPWPQLEKDFERCVRQHRASAPEPEAARQAAPQA